VRLTTVCFATISTLTNQPRPEVTSPITDIRADLIHESPWRPEAQHSSGLGMGNRPRGGAETGRRLANESLSVGAVNETLGMTNDGRLELLGQVASLWPWPSVKHQRQASRRFWNFYTPPLEGGRTRWVYIRSKRHNSFLVSGRRSGQDLSLAPGRPSRPR